MAQALEHLFIVGLFSGLAVWFALDIHRHLQTGEVKLWRSVFFSVPVADRHRDPFNYWFWIIFKGLAALSAAILAACYFYFYIAN